MKDKLRPPLVNIIVLITDSIRTKRRNTIQNSNVVRFLENIIKR